MLLEEPGLEVGLPPELARAPHIVSAGVVSETFVIWRKSSDPTWSIGPVELPIGVMADPDGSEYLLRPTTNVAEAHRFLETHYESEVPMDAVEALFALTPMDTALVGRLAPNRDARTVQAEVATFGYPIA